MSEENDVTPEVDANPVDQDVENQGIPADADAETPEGDEDSANSEQEEGEGEEEGDGQKPKRKTGFQKRIDELTKARHEAEQKAEAVEKKLEEVRLESLRNQQSQQQQQIQSNFPKLEDYGYDEGQYQQAVQGYYQQAQQQQQVQAKVADAVKKYPDFIEKIQDPRVPSLQQANSAAYQAVLESDVMPDMVYHLAQNPAEILAFQALTPVQAVKAVARLEFKLEQEAMKADAPKPVSTPPPAPPSKVGGGSGPSEKDPSKMNANEWMAWRNKRLNK